MCNTEAFVRALNVPRWMDTRLIIEARHHILVLVFDSTADHDRWIVLTNAGDAAWSERRPFRTECEAQAHIDNVLAGWNLTQPEIEQRRVMRKAIELAKRKGRKFEMLDDDYFEDGVHPSTLDYDDIPPDPSDIEEMRVAAYDNAMRLMADVREPA